MNFLSDESVDKPIVDLLRRRGHRVWYVAEMEPGISDEAVLDLANQETLMLVTSDKDFGEMVFRQSRLGPGIILLRLAGLSPALKAQLVASAINGFAIEQFHQAFTVITPGMMRIRRQLG